MNGHIPVGRLSAWIDGDLTAPSAAATAEHVTACARCQAEVEGLRHLIAGAGGLEDRAPDHDLWGAIALATQRTARGRRRAAVWTVLAVAAGLAAFVVSSRLLRQEGLSEMGSTRAPTGAAGKTQGALAPAGAAPESWPALDAAIAETRAELATSEDQVYLQVHLQRLQRTRAHLFESSSLGVTQAD